MFRGLWVVTKCTLGPFGSDWKGMSAFSLSVSEAVRMAWNTISWGYPLTMKWWDNIREFLRNSSHVEHILLSLRNCE